jgi:hypothetical protein
VVGSGVSTVEEPAAEVELLVAGVAVVVLGVTVAAPELLVEEPELLPVVEEAGVAVVVLGVSVRELELPEVELLVEAAGVAVVVSGVSVAELALPVLELELELELLFPSTSPMTTVLMESASSVTLVLSCWLDKLSVTSCAELSRLERMSTTWSSGVKKATLSTLASVDEALELVVKATRTESAGRNLEKWSIA